MAEKKKNLFQRIFSRNKKEPLEESTTISMVNPSKEISDKISEMRLYTNTARVLKITDVNNASEELLIGTYRDMDNDSIISGALDLYADNATQVNSKTGHVVSIRSSNKLFEETVNDFLWNIVKIDNRAWQIVRDIARDGYIYLDTKPIGNTNAWVFLPVIKPYNIQALTQNGEDIDYYLVTEDINDTLDSKLGGFYSGTDKSSIYKTIEPRDRFISGFATSEIVGDAEIEISSLFSDKTEETTTQRLWIKSGRSLLAPIVNTWETLVMLEKSLFINRLSRSKQFNIVGINVTGTDNKQAQNIIDNIKKSLKSSETIDEQASNYLNRTSPVQLDDFVFIPNRDGVGSITIDKIVPSDIQQNLDDINYQRNKLFGGLGILKAYLGFEETTPSGLGSTTLVQLDERFGRRVKRLQQPLRDVVGKMVTYYHLYSSPNNTLDNLPDFTVELAEVSDAASRASQELINQGFDRANNLLGIIKDDLFIDYVDTNKLFKYIFEDVIGIETVNFDNTRQPDDVKLKILNLSESIKDIDNKKRTNGYLKRLLENDKNKIKPNWTFKGKLQEFLQVALSDDEKIKELSESVFILRDSDYTTELEESKKDIDYLNNQVKKVLTEVQNNNHTTLRNKSKKEDPERIKKSKKIQVDYYGIVDSDTVLFYASAEDPEKNRKAGRPTEYEVRVKLKDLLEMVEDNIENGFKITDQEVVRLAVWAGDLELSCTCPAAKYWGMQYRGTLEDYSLIKNWIEPTVLEPKQPLCKHTIAVITKALPFIVNTLVRDLRRAGTLPDRKEKSRILAEIEKTKSGGK